MNINIPRPDASDFTTEIDNPLFTLRPGSTFVYEDVDGGGSNTFVVKRDTAVIDGVTCVVVHDTAMVNGIVIEDTFDWFAQDADGNVWYFGEATQSFEPGNPIPISTAGSWETGVDGAQPGIVMLADPKIGDRYNQEFAPGIAEDYARVLKLDSTVDTVYGSFDGVLKTRDVNPLDPSVEQKYYVPGVGNVLTTNADGEREQLVKIIVDGTGGSDNLLGYAGGDHINGLAGNDRLRGAAGNDIMSGGTGSDNLAGGKGHDDLNGDAGNDRLCGGVGGDSFIFRDLDNGLVETDTIVDYNKADVDVIDLAGGTARIAGETLDGTVWVLTLTGDGDVIRLVGPTDSNGNGQISDELLLA